ncbi:unnamed protein product, partial [Urochloa humidicola]
PVAAPPVSALSLPKCRRRACEPRHAAAHASPDTPPPRPLRLSSTCLRHPCLILPPNLALARCLCALHLTIVRAAREFLPPTLDEAFEDVRGGVGASSRSAASPPHGSAAGAKKGDGELR